MAIGMTYEQYWYGDPLMVRAFYKADKLRQRRADENAWLNGMYFMAAINATIGNIGNKGTLNEYPKEPFSAEGERLLEQKKEKRKEQEATWAKAWMAQFVEAGKSWGQKN